jgi:hypothetical protein
MSFQPFQAHAVVFPVLLQGKQRFLQGRVPCFLCVENLLPVFTLYRV